MGNVFRERSLFTLCPLLLVLMGGWAAMSPPAAPRDEPFASDSLRHLMQGGHSGFEWPVRAVAGDSATFRRLWTDAVRGNRNPPSMPSVDFQRDMVIVAAMGSMRSTGHTIRIDSVVAVGPALQVHTVVIIHGPECLSGMMMTNPVDIVVAPRSAAVVEFLDHHNVISCRQK